MNADASRPETVPCLECYRPQEFEQLYGSIHLDVSARGGPDNPRDDSNAGPMPNSRGSDVVARHFDVELDGVSTLHDSQYLTNGEV
jgi:hypothetical protein